MTIETYLSLSEQVIQSARQTLPSDPDRAYQILADQLAHHLQLLNRIVNQKASGKS